MSVTYLSEKGVIRLSFKKFFINIICGFVPSSSKRKELRAEMLYTPPKLNMETKLENGNKIIVCRRDGLIVETNKYPGIKIDFKSKNSTCIIHEPTKFQNCYFSLGYNCKIEIQSTHLYIHNLTITTRDKNEVIIGKDCCCHGVNISNHDEQAKKVIIGDNCLFSYNINMRPSDGHTIYHEKSKAILNRPQGEINIGNHVWVGMNVNILKDVKISDNSIVGAASVVTKRFEETNVIIGGTPAKILKQETNWDIRHTDYFKETYQN